MPSNIEIKARVDNLEALKSRTASLSGQTPTVIHQRDTFFKVPDGRLKLRHLQNQPSKLVFYKRPDCTGPKHSEFYITETNDPESMQRVLEACLGVLGEVKKTRLLYMVGQTRVHIDDVEGLGNFMELEVVMKDSQALEEGQRIAEDLMVKLGIEKDSLESGAYFDLLQDKS